MSKFRVKYGYTTNEQNIAKALANGSIDAGDIVIVNKSGIGTLRFILEDGSTIIPISADVDAEQLKTAVESALDESIDEKIETAVDNKIEENLEDKVKPIVDAAVEEAVGNSQGSWEDF